MQALQESFFKEIFPLRKDLQTKRLEMRVLWAENPPDQAKILAKQKEINQLREQIQEKATKFRLETRQVLTPEQQAQLGPYGPGYGPGFGMRGGFGHRMGYGMGYGACPRW